MTSSLDQSIGTIRINTFSIDDVTYQVCEERIDDQLILTSLESLPIKQPLKTVRFICGIPWEVRFIYPIRSRFKNFMFGQGWQQTFQIEWSQVRPQKYDRKSFIRLILSHSQDDFHG